MKKLITIGVVLLLVLGVNVLAQADDLDIDKLILVELSVSDQFGFVINDDDFRLDFGVVAPGGGDSDSIDMYISSNHIQPWAINASSDGIVGKNPANSTILPIVVSTYEGTAGQVLTGTIVTGLTLDSTATPIYTAGVGEYPSSGFTVNCAVGVGTDLDTPADAYEGIIMLTMTE